MAYVYRHIRLDKNEPFYIGIGSDSDGKYKRAKSKDGRNNHWHNIIACTDYKVQILFDDLTWEDAIKKEIELVALYGRRDLGLGTLVNLTNGGDGSVGCKPNEDTKQKISDKNKGKKASEETRKKMSESQTGKTLSEDTRKKMSESRKGKKSHRKNGTISDISKKKMSESTKKWHLDNRERYIESVNISMELRKKNEWVNPKKGTKQKGKNVINNQNGFVYESAKDAFESMNAGYKYIYFCRMLNGDRPNKTNFEYIV
jgi:hypothetical protein